MATPELHGDRENCRALVVRAVRRRRGVLIGGRLRLAIALRLPMFVRLRLSIFRRGQTGAAVAVARGTGSADARDRYRRKQDQKQQSETDSHDFLVHKILSMAPRGREGARTYLLAYLSARKKNVLNRFGSSDRNGTCAGESCAEARLIIGVDGGLYSFEHFCAVAGLPLQRVPNGTDAVPGVF